MTYKEEEEEKEGWGWGFRAAAVCFSHQRTGRRDGGGVKLKICLSDCCLATILLQVISVGAGLGSSRG